MPIILLFIDFIGFPLTALAAFFKQFPINCEAYRFTD